MGLITALAITIHNFPGGHGDLCVGASGEERASHHHSIAIHNIPRGRCRGSADLLRHPGPEKAFWYSLLSGLSEPFGAILGYLLLRRS